MTKIDPEHPVVRETAAVYKDRPIILEQHPSYLVFRVKGLRSIRYTLSVEGAFQMAARSQANQTIAENRAAKPARPRRVRRGILSLKEP